MSRLSTQQQNNLRQAAFNSVASEHTTGLPAELTLAQWALESAWGSRQPENNCFGIKAYPGCHGIQLLETTEVIAGKRQVIRLPFATFPTLAACFDKHAQLITNSVRYKTIWEKYRQSGDLKRLVATVGTIYATAPDYAETVWAIIEMPAVKSELALCRGLGNRPN